MIPVFLIMYGGEDDGYGGGRYGAVESAGYGAGADRYVTDLFDGADSYIDMVLGGDAENGPGDGYGQEVQPPPYNDTSSRAAGYDGADQYSGGGTVITVVYEEMYEPDYRVFGP